MANARNLSLRCATYLMLSVLLVDLHNSASTSEHVYVKRAAACCWIVQSKGTACDAVDLFYLSNVPFAPCKLLRLRGQRVSVSVAVLLAVFGSMTPVGTETVAVLEIELVADALIVPVAL